MIKQIIILIVAATLIVVFLNFQKTQNDSQETNTSEESPNIPIHEEEFPLLENIIFNDYKLNDSELVNLSFNLQKLENGTPRVFRDFKETTNFRQSIIPFEKVLSGGPAKDGIPSLVNPVFEPISENKDRDEELGVLIEVGDEVRWYPYSILVWHEIANDTIGDQHFAVTFCPLCGSAITFNRNLDGEILELGVSGLLYESNMIFYDRTTESLWSQAKGQSVIGKLAGTKFEHFPMKIMTKKDVVENYPQAKSLSRKTGHIRNYGGSPYSGYEEDSNFYFPTSEFSDKFHPKTLMLVTPFEEMSVVLPFEDTSNLPKIFEVNDKVLTLVDKDGEVYLEENGEPLINYIEMWFSWNIHHKEDGIVWGS